MTTHQEVALSELHDHCTLNEASSTVRFRSTGTTARVYPMEDYQFIIEDDVDKDGTHRIITKRVIDAGTGLKLLRGAYSLFAVFFVSIVGLIAAPIFFFCEI